MELEKNKFYMAKGHPNWVVYVESNGVLFNMGCGSCPAEEYELIENPMYHISSLKNLELSCAETAFLMRDILEKSVQTPNQKEVCSPA